RLIGRGGIPLWQRYSAPRGVRGAAAGRRPAGRGAVRGGRLAAPPGPADGGAAVAGGGAVRGADRPGPAATARARPHGVGGRGRAGPGAEHGLDAGPSADRRIARLHLTATARRRIEGWRDRRHELAARALERLDPADREALGAAVPAMAKLVDALRELES